MVGRRTVRLVIAAAWIVFAAGPVDAGVACRPTAGQSTAGRSVEGGNPVGREDVGREDVRRVGAGREDVGRVGAGPGGGGRAGHGEVGHGGGLAERLRQIMDDLHFERVLDRAPPGSPQARALARRRAGGEPEPATARRRARVLAGARPEPISQQPQLDATVIELDRTGRPVSSGTVLMSPRYPHGRIVPVDRDLHTDDVRWRQWDGTGWYARQGEGTIDVVPGRENAGIDFMLPYPASVLKLMVAFGVLRLVDDGLVRLDDTYAYLPAVTSALCGGPTRDTVRGYLDASITWSSNGASCALIKLLHDHGAVGPLNRTFQRLGLETLRLENTDPANGGHWGNAITMSSLDTAKLLMLVNGAPGRLWTAPGGTPVTGAVLSDPARRFLVSTLEQQGLNEVLSTANWCGRRYPAPGIPQVVPSRWVGPDGTVTVAGAAYGRDVRPCDQAAEVSFAHKTGLVFDSGADVGIVRSLPGRPWRGYIVAVFSNLGDRYLDAGRPPTPPHTAKVSYTERLARLGRAIDSYETRRGDGDR